MNIPSFKNQKISLIKRNKSEICIAVKSIAPYIRKKLQEDVNSQTFSFKFDKVQPAIGRSIMMLI